MNYLFYITFKTMYKYNDMSYMYHMSFFKVLKNKNFIVYINA